MREFGRGLSHADSPRIAVRELGVERSFTASDVGGPQLLLAICPGIEEERADVRGGLRGSSGGELNRLLKPSPW